MNSFIYLAPVAGVIALIFAFYKAMTINKSEAGNDRMKEIASAIAEGARAFLFAEYKVLVIFVAVLFVVLGFGISWLTAVCFLVGALFSTLAGYFGMTVATKANVRTANAAKESGMNKALSIAFSGGAVMGLSVVGLGIIGISVIFIILNATGEVTTDAVSILTGFSLGASSIALFARVGGGIYTKAADVGADLVGKVEAGIPEDDPRNPAVIADNVGDNVGDVAGMGADLFESYVGALVSAITLGLVATNIGSASHFMAALFPLVIAGIGIIASVIATFFVRGKDGSDPQKALNAGEYTATALVIIASAILSNTFFGNFNAFIAIIAGLVVGTIIGKVTEMYTSEKYKSVQEIAESSQTGSATNIISGLSVGMKSTCIPIVVIAIGILVAFHFCGMYGIALAAVGMLSTTGMTIAVDATKDLLLNVLEYHPFLIKPNHHELGEIFGVTLSEWSDVIPYAKNLQERGAKNVLVSMGGKGAVLIAENGQIIAGESSKGVVKNTVGAGDSMVAGFMAGWMQKRDYEHAFRMGLASGGASACSENLATRQEIETEYEKTAVHYL